MPRASSEKHAAQRPEKLRKTLSLNYKSAPVCGGAVGAKPGKILERTDSLLFGKRDMPTFVIVAEESVLLLVTLWSICNECLSSSVRNSVAYSVALV